MAHTDYQTVRDAIIGKPEWDNQYTQFVFKYFKDPELSPGMNIDGTSPVSFRVQYPFPWLLHRINFAINDANITSIKFGGITALSKGLTVSLFNSNDVKQFDFLDGIPLKANRDFVALAGVDIRIRNDPGVDLVKVRWTIAHAGKPLYVGSKDYLEILVQDDLSSLDFFRCFAQGVRSLRAV